MSLATKLQPNYSHNPFVSFDSNGVGVSRVYDDVWDYTAYEQNQFKVSFTAFDKAHRANVQVCLAKLLDYYTTELRKSDNYVSVGWLLTRKDTLNCIVTQWGKSDFTLLSNDRVWDEVKKSLKGKYTKGTLEGIAGTINHLTSANVTTRYVKCKELYYLSKNANGDKQAIALPPNIHAQVLQKAVNTVDLYHSYRTAISEVMAAVHAFRDEQYSLEFKKKKTVKLSKQEIKNIDGRVRRKGIKLGKSRGIPNFKSQVTGEWVNNIIRDCLVSVALFSGARKREVCSMNPDSYDFFGAIPILTGLTSKGNNGQPSKTTWLTHPIALKALELAFDASQFARNIHKNSLQLLLNNEDINKDKYERSLQELDSAFIVTSMALKCYKGLRETYLCGFDHGLNLKSFNIKATEEDVREFDIINPAWAGQLKVGGTLPKLSMHDFRRSFAVFMIRNRLGNHQTIKYQFKHKNISMSGWYANYAELARVENMLLDSELMTLCNKAMEDVAVDAYDEIYNESKVLSGPEGQRIFKNKQKALRRGEQVYMNREELRSLVKIDGKDLIMLPTGAYCTSPDCDRLSSVKYFHADDNLLYPQIITDRIAKIQAKERFQLIKTFRGLNDFNDHVYAAILAALKEKILYIEKTLNTHHINFEPFTDKIEAIAA